MFGRGNSYRDLMNFFSIPGRPVSVEEFSAFWESCTESLRSYFKSVSLA